MRTLSNESVAVALSDEFTNALAIHQDTDVKGKGTESVASTVLNIHISNLIMDKKSTYSSFDMKVLRNSRENEQQIPILYIERRVSTQAKKVNADSGLESETAREYSTPFRALSTSSAENSGSSDSENEEIETAMKDLANESALHLRTFPKNLKIHNDHPVANHTIHVNDQKAAVENTLATLKELQRLNKLPKEIYLSGQGQAATDCIAMANAIFLAFNNRIKLHITLLLPADPKLVDEKVIAPNVETFTYFHSTSGNNLEDVIASNGHTIVTPLPLQLTLNKETKQIGDFNLSPTLGLLNKAANGLILGKGKEPEGTVLNPMISQINAIRKNYSLPTVQEHKHFLREFPIPNLEKREDRIALIKKAYKTRESFYAEGFARVKEIQTRYFQQAQANKEGVEITMHRRTGSMQPGKLNTDAVKQLNVIQKAYEKRSRYGIFSSSYKNAAIKLDLDFAKKHFILDLEKYCVNRAKGDFYYFGGKTFSKYNKQDKLDAANAMLYFINNGGSDALAELAKHRGALQQGHLGKIVEKYQELFNSLSKECNIPNSRDQKI